MWENLRLAWKGYKRRNEQPLKGLGSSFLRKSSFTFLESTLGMGDLGFFFYSYFHLFPLSWMVLFNAWLNLFIIIDNFNFRFDLSSISCFPFYSSKLISIPFLVNTYLSLGKGALGLLILSLEFKKVLFLQPILFTFLIFPPCTPRSLFQGLTRNSPIFF